MARSRQVAAAWMIGFVIGAVLAPLPWIVMMHKSIMSTMMTKQQQHYIVVPAYLLDGLGILEGSGRNLKNHFDDTNEKDKDDISYPEPALVQFDHHDALFLHMGKAAGGTILERTRDVWKMKIKECHPKLCPLATQYPNRTGLLLSVRDPIDRWVSAYYWRLHIICNPDGSDPRKIDNGASHNPQRFCKKMQKKKTKHLFDGTFHHDANRVAEALCSLSDPKLAQLANLTMPQVHHAQIFIHDWLDFDWKSEHLFALVVGDRDSFDLEAQVDAAMQWLHNRTRFETPELFRKRIQHAQRRVVTGKYVHSAFSPKGKRQLSLAAQKCLAEYYRKDYILLRDKKELLCKTEECLKGIQAILDRRMALLSDKATSQAVLE